MEGRRWGDGGLSVLFWYSSGCPSPLRVLPAVFALPAVGAAEGTASASSKTKARVAIELLDGSRIIGQLTSETLLFKSASLGELKFPVLLSLI